MRILFISQYFPPEIGAPSARTIEHARQWVAEGHQVTVLTGFPKHLTGMIPPEYQGKLFQREEVEGVEVWRTWLWATPNVRFAKRTFAYLSFMLSAILAASLRRWRGDVVIATSPQFFVGVAGYVVSRIKRRPFVFEVRDLWPEGIVAVGLLKRDALVARILERIELFLYRKADCIITVTEAARDDMVRRGIDPDKIHPIHNGADLGLFAPGPDVVQRLAGDLVLVRKMGESDASHVRTHFDRSSLARAMLEAIGQHLSMGQAGAGEKARDTAIHFHRIASQFDDLYEKESRGPIQRWFDSKLRASIYRRFELVFEKLGDVRGKRILDVGCGGGRYAVTMGNLGAEKVVGIDFAENMIVLAKDLAHKEGLSAEHVSFVCSDAATAEFDETFDYAIAMGVFDYVADAESFLRSILAKVQTRVVASFPVKYSIWTPQRLLRYRLFKRCPLYFYSRSRIEALVRSLDTRAYEINDAYRDYVVVIDK